MNISPDTATASVGGPRTATLTWTDRQGRGRLERGPAADLARRLATLRAEARLRIDDTVVGECTYAPGRTDDRRARWVWWYDADAVGLPSPAVRAASSPDAAAAHVRGIRRSSAGKENR